jgi:DNA end-binding protein Ku
MRVIWKGTVSFGLVSVPVSLYSGSKRRKLPFRLLHEADAGPIGYRKFCEKENSEVDEDEIVKGYEIADEEYVILEEEDFEAAEVDLSQTIEIDTFTEADRLKPEWFSKPYYLQVDKTDAKPYILLRKAMEETGKVAVAKTVLRNREHLCCLMPRGDFLLLVVMRFS